MKNYCENLNLIYGIGTAEDFEDLRPLLTAKNSALAGFAEQDIEKRISPAATLPGVKSIVALALPYGTKKPPKPADVPRGSISMAAVGEDYHKVLAQNLETVAKLLDLETYLCFVDTGPLVDRAVAMRCGLGLAAKNGCIRTVCGSAVFFGYILTTAELTPTPPASVPPCGSCRLCAQSCPTGALSETGFQMERCRSYLTQKKGLLTVEEMRLMGDAVYGCDVCQTACPHYSALQEGDAQALYPDLTWLLACSEGEFREKFAHTAAGWRGRRVLQRNALVALWSLGADMKDYKNHPSELIRQTAERLEERPWDTGEAEG